MENLKLLVPLKLANLAVSMKRVDKSSLFEALKDYHSDKLDLKEDPIEALAEKPLPNQFVVTSVDPINEVAEIVVSNELYQELCNNGVVGGICVAYGCDLTPVITMPFWKVTKVHEEMLAVTIEANVEDFLGSEDDMPLRSSEEDSTCLE